MYKKSVKNECFYRKIRTNQCRICSNHIKLQDQIDTLLNISFVRNYIRAPVR